MKHVPPPVGEPLIDIPLPAPEPHADAAQALSGFRRMAEAEIERLLSILDAIDDDADLEPSLASPEPATRFSLFAESHPGATDDREDDTDLESTDHDDDEDGRDDEPSLGSCVDHGSGANYQSVESRVFGLDLEDEHDGREPSLSGVSVEVTYDARDLELDLGTFDQMLNQETSTLQVGQRHGFVMLGLGVVIPDGEVDDSDYEPSLGAGDDREDDAGDSIERDDDTEPPCTPGAGVDQRRWSL